MIIPPTAITLTKERATGVPQCCQEKSLLSDVWVGNFFAKVGRKSSDFLIFAIFRKNKKGE
jgi:hypothetical protein